MIYLDHYGDKPAQVFNVADDPGQKKDLARTIPKETLAAWQAETRAWYGQVRGRYVATQEAWLQTIQRPDDSPAIATWEGSLSLLGCDLANPEVLPEENAWVKCRWRAEKPITSAWTLLATISVKSRSDETEWTPARRRREDVHVVARLVDRRCVPRGDARAFAGRGGHDQRGLAASRWRPRAHRRRS